MFYLEAGLFLKNILKINIFILVVFYSCQSSIVDKKNKPDISTSNIRELIEQLIKDSTGLENCILLDTMFLEVVDELATIPILLEDKVNYSNLVVKDSILILPIYGLEGYALVFLKVGSRGIEHIGGSQQNMYIYSSNYAKVASFSKVQFVDGRDEFVNCFIYDIDVKYHYYEKDTMQISDEVYLHFDNLEKSQEFFNQIFEDIKKKYRVSEKLTD